MTQINKIPNLKSTMLLKKKKQEVKKYILMPLNDKKGLNFFTKKVKKIPSHTA